MTDWLNQKINQSGVVLLLNSEILEKRTENIVKIV